MYPAFTIHNPWIYYLCDILKIPTNKLETFLQENYGQLAEDLILEALLRSKFEHLSLPFSALRYLDIGSNHPIQTSNTFLFYKKWSASGVLVEANPSLISLLESVRPNDILINKAVVPIGYPSQVELNVAVNCELSSISVQHLNSFGSIGDLQSQITVDTIQLDTLCTEYFSNTGLHLLSIDIEGLDLDVISSSSFTIRPFFIIAEPSKHINSDSVSNFNSTLSSKDYIQIASTDYNLIFIDKNILNS